MSDTPETPPIKPAITNQWWDQNIDHDLGEAIVKFKLVLNNKVVARDWRIDVAIDYDMLEEDLESMSSIYAFWSAVLSEAKKKQKMTEFKMMIKRGKILAAIAKDAKEGVKLTKDDKDNIVNLDTEFASLTVESIEIETTVSKLFGIVDSLKMKSDNLRSLAGFKKQEMQG